jgi:hypothetical protein
VALGPQEPPSDDWKSLMSGPPGVSVRRPRAADRPDGCCEGVGVTDVFGAVTCGQ